MTGNLGTYLKKIENKFTSVALKSDEPVYCRLDGRSFSKFTKKNQHTKPCDINLLSTMIETTEDLFHEWNADLAFVQSDEISLLWLPKTTEGYEFVFGGKIQKLASTLASSCTMHFILNYLDRFSEMKYPYASFDCRVMNMSKEDAFKMFYWRHVDAKKNAISGYCLSEFSPRQLHGKNSDERILMLEGKGIDYKKHPNFLYGTFLYNELTDGKKSFKMSSVDIKGMKQAQSIFDEMTSICGVTGNELLDRY